MTNQALLSTAYAALYYWLDPIHQPWIPYLASVMLVYALDRVTEFRKQLPELGYSISFWGLIDNTSLVPAGHQNHKMGDLPNTPAPFPHG